MSRFFYPDILEVGVPTFSGADYIASHTRGLVLIGHLLVLLFRIGKFEYTK
jgi:hypothetical protein